MSRPLARTAAAVAGTTLAVSTAFVATAAAVPTSTDGAPSFQEFRASTFKDFDTQYIVNGDEPAATDGVLRQFYDTMVAQPDTDVDGLIVNRVNGQDDKWSASQALNLTYCVSTKFGADYSRVVSAMTAGVGQWEAATTKVNFTHVTTQDGSCTTRNNAIVFSVEPTRTTQYIARAFFPSSPKSSRNVLVNAASLYNAGSWTPSNIMAHELGHTLGFRHEHTRPEAGTCFEDNNWRALTPYDSASIMHYPQCNGTSDDLSMTDQDRAGVRALYGS
ncbi:M57 family metalloprotease [Oryzobacter sp. R7]|uniref:M57 family metalloprotease n=1 Tax=Oryzobacter faecalis TaxID=3388656 RepID=UPI00398CAF7D